MPHCSASAWASCSSLIRPWLSAILPSNWPGCCCCSSSSASSWSSVMKPEVDEDLTDAANRHERDLVARFRLAVFVVLRLIVLGPFLPSSSSSNSPRSALAMRAASSSGVCGLGQHVVPWLHFCSFQSLNSESSEQDHALLGPGLDGRGDAEGLVFANQVADGRVAHQQLVGRAAPAADLGDQRLREHADDRRGELRADLVLLVGRKDVDDAVDRALGAGGVQRAEHDVAGFGGADGGFDRGQVAQLTHQDHVGILPQGTAQRLGEAGHVDADLALVDRRLLVGVIELDRVLDRDDVVIEVLVQVVDHAGQRGALARAGRPGDQKQTAGPLNQSHAGRRQAQLLHASTAWPESAAAPWRCCRAA